MLRTAVSDLAGYGVWGEDRGELTDPTGRLGRLRLRLLLRLLRLRPRGGGVWIGRPFGLLEW